MAGTLADSLRGRPARRGTLAPWARALAGQDMPAAYEATVTAPQMPAMPPEPGPQGRPAQPWQLLDSPTMPAAEAPPFPPPQAPPAPRRGAPQMGGLTTDDLNALSLAMARGIGFEARPGLDPRAVEEARMRMAAVGIPGYGG